MDFDDGVALTVSNFSEFFQFIKFWLAQNRAEPGDCINVDDLDKKDSKLRLKLNVALVKDTGWLKWLTFWWFGEELMEKMWKDGCWNFSPWIYSLSGKNKKKRSEAQAAASTTDSVTR